MDYYKPNFYQFFGGSRIPELIITFPHVSQSPRANHQPTEVLNTAHMGSTMFYLNIGVTWSDTHLYLYGSRYLWAQPLMYWLQLSFFQGPWRLMVCPVGCCQLLSWRFHVRIYIYTYYYIYIYYIYIYIHIFNILKFTIHEVLKQWRAFGTQIWLVISSFSSMMFPYFAQKDAGISQPGVYLAEELATWEDLNPDALGSNALGLQEIILPNIWIYIYGYIYIWGIIIMNELMNWEFLVTMLSVRGLVSCRRALASVRVFFD